MAKEKGKHDWLLCLLLAIIVVLVLVIGGGAYYFLVIDKEEEQVEENKNTIVVPTATVTPKTQVSNPYEKYQDFEWKVRDEEDIEKLQQLEWVGRKLIIEEEKLYIVDESNNKKMINTITDTPKYIFGIYSQTLAGVRILTEEGTVWENSDYDLFDPFADKFKKVDIDGEVIDITEGEFDYGDFYFPTFYLLKTGKLIDESGKTYEEIHGNHLFMLDLDARLFVNSDYTISSYTSEGWDEYENIVDSEGNIVKVNQVFWNYNTDEGEFEYYIITNKNELLYFLKYDNVATQFVITNDSFVEKFKTYDTENQKKEAKITFADGTDLDITIYRIF